MGLWHGVFVSLGGDYERLRDAVILHLDGWELCIVSKRSQGGLHSVLFAGL
jgi:hypothetical protein